MDAPPQRNPRYHRGAASPHSIRFNDALWAAFDGAARARGWTAIAALRWLMEEFVAAEQSKRRASAVARDAGASAPTSPPALSVESDDG